MSMSMYMPSSKHIHLDLHKSRNIQAARLSIEFCRLHKKNPYVIYASNQE